MKRYIRDVQFKIPAIVLIAAAVLIGMPGVGGIADAKELTALEVMQKVEDRDEGDNSTSEMSMILIDKRGNERIRKIKSYTKFKGDDKRRIMFFLHPADVKGTGFLTYDYDDDAKDDDQWLFLPALRKSKRIASGDKDGSFMGSDLTYADMTSRNLPDYEFKIMEEKEVGGKPCYVISSTPNKKARDETGYEKSIVFVRKDNFVVVRALNWIIKGKKQKYFDVKKLVLIDNIWTATETHVFTKKDKKLLHKTILKFKDVKYNQNLDDSTFTIRTLEKGL